MSKWDEVEFINKHELEQVEKYGYVVVGDSAKRAYEIRELLNDIERLEAENAAISEKLEKVIAMLKEEGTITCPDCCGTGHWVAPGPGPSYVITRPDGNHSVACERCGGDFDSIGSGVIEPDEESSLYARAKAIVEDK